jgi:4a-hydroxytetrahydrobiopterin dehydratase
MSEQVESGTGVGASGGPESAPSRDMLGDQQIADAGLADWRKLGQGLHARFVPSSFAAAARFLAAVAEVTDEAGHAPQVRMDARFVDLKLISDDAIYRDDDGVEHQVEWVTQRDVELARRISDVAREHGLRADPSTVTAIELALDTAHADAVAPVWSALLTGGADAQGRGTISHDVRDSTWRVPILWSQETEEHETPRQRFHVDVQVPYDVADQRIAAALAAGGVVVHDSDPSYVVIADPDGNKACIARYPHPA